MNKHELDHLKECERQKGAMAAHQKCLEALDAVIEAFDRQDCEALLAWRGDVETDFMQAKAWLVVNDPKSKPSKEFPAWIKAQPEEWKKPAKKKAAKKKVDA